ncbi:hypothetical protein NEDG_01884 [Nematocida displodere]|uniref:Glycosyl transferase family 1 domain-containing protein n=1 Tax=Nematocida displodere TaxID=1805483 RepID=A0A177EI94_9MICR|nr:hypothetical protein NEDG_01884 [Nematocida displodere]
MNKGVRVLDPGRFNYHYQHKHQNTMRGALLLVVALIAYLADCKGQKKTPRKYKLGVFTTYKPTICGIAQFSANMVNGIKKSDKNIEVEIFNIVKSNPGPPRWVDGVKVRDILCTPNSEPKEFRALASYVKANHFNGVIINHEYWLISRYKHYEVLTAAISATGTAVYTLLHTPHSYPTAARKRHVRKVAASSTNVFVMSWKGKHYLHHSYGIPKSKIVYFPHGIKTARVNKSHLKSLKIPAGKFIIYSDGIMHREKGLVRIVEALTILKKRKQISNILLLVAGINSKGSKYMEQITEMIRRRDLKNHFMWIPKFLSIEEMATLHNRANVYITLFDEVIPTSGTLTYAMFVGGTIISTPYRYSVELLGVDNTPGQGTSNKAINDLRHEKGRIAYAGACVPFHRPEVLANIIDRLKKNPALAKKLRKRSKQRVKGYSWKNVSAHIAKFLKTKDKKPINPDPYTTPFLLSECIWNKKDITNFLGSQVATTLVNGTYLLYKDSFIKITASVANRQLQRMNIKTLSPKNSTRKLSRGRLSIDQNQHLEITAYNSNYAWVITPNIVFVVGYQKSDKSLFFKVLFENMHGNATGGLGTSLRQKYDLTKPPALGFDRFKIQAL